MDPRIITALAVALSTAEIRFDSADIAKADAGDIAGRIGELADAFTRAKDALAAATSKHDMEGAEGAEGTEGEEEEVAEDGFDVEKKEDEEDEEKADSRRLAWHATRTALTARADSFGVKAEDLSNVALRRAIVLAARKDAKTDGSRDYYAAAFDLLPKSADASNRADAWSRVKPPGKDATDTRVDTADGNPSKGWTDTIAAQFNARHGDAR
jgi:hypothetical protein